MARPLSLEEFELESTPVAIDKESDSLTEQDKLEAFEQGYKAGWDDSTSAQQQDQSRITADLESTLKDLSFTFHEARTHVLQGVEPLVYELVEKVLPAFAKEGLPKIVSDRLSSAFAELSDRPVILSVSPQTRPAVEVALPKDPGFPITIKEEPTLGDGQVFLNLGASEELLDLDESIRCVKKSIEEFFEINSRKQVNGQSN